MHDYASSSYIIYIVEILRSVVAHGRTGGHVVERIGRLPLQSHIIVVCGVDYCVFRFGVVQSPFLPLGQFVALLVYAPQASVGTLTVVVEVLVARRSLAEAHLLHLGYEQFDVVVGVGGGFVKLLPGFVIVHAPHACEGHVVERLGLSFIIA